jgi:hypothetical protein
MSELVLVEKKIPVVVTVGIQGPAGAPSLGKYHLHELNQVDIDNGFVTIADIVSRQDKENIIVYLSNVGLLLEYGVDYTIDADGKITWNGYELEGELVVGDIIKIFY